MTLVSCTVPRGTALFIFSAALQLLVVGADILVAPAFHAEPTENDHQLGKAQPLVQVAGMQVGRHHRVELHHTKAQRFAHGKAVLRQLFSDV